MRYEDASHTSAFQGSQPIANDDLDSVPAGSKTPATGNLITGEGTQTGSAGADIAAGAHVAAIAGKGGEDTSFAGGKLSVSGEHGKLSVDAEGNYIYQANAGVENVRDRFTYTLADNQGATDTGSLIVEIGKTPVVIKANAQQIVPGPDGVVTLPPGVELSDIRVVGRNLVIDMPDGTQLIIIDGAIFVPQLVLNGVEIPSTNLAALLIGQEPQPAAGEAPQSSGGNFDAPVPPLDPGVPLGDLIPPTEYDYTPPEPQEVFPDVNDEEPAILIQPDGQPASVAAVDSVDEDGLPARDGNLPDEPEGSDEGADGNPTNNSDPDETTAGTIIINSPDGVASVTINGVLVTGVIGQVIPGDFGNLTITGFSGDNILYSYTLTDNTSGDNTHDDFSVVLTDEDGDIASATLTINIIDDVPTARNDTDATVNGVATGNVMTDAAPGDVGDTDTNAADTVGADNATLTAVSGFGGSSDSTFEGGLLNVNGQFGTLAIDAQGNYTYTVNPNVGGGGVDVFTYTLTDGDGDTTTATLTITNPDLQPDLPNPELIRLDDDVIPGADGNPDGPGDDDPDVVGQNVVNGQLAGTGGDGDLDYSFSGTNTLPAGFTANAVDADTLQILQGATVVMTIELNTETGAFTVTQNNPIDHPSLDGQAGDNTENNLDFSIGVQVVDADGDVEPAAITINVDDDTPVIVPEVQLGGTVDEDGVLEGADDGGDGDGNAGGVNDVPGENTVVQGNVSALFASGADQPLTFSLLTDTSGLPDLTSNGAPVTYSVVGNTLTASANGSPVFTLVLNPATGDYTFTLLDQLDHPSLDGEVGDDTENPPASDLTIALGSIIQATDADGDSVTAPANGLIITVDDDSPEEFEECPDDVIAVNDPGSTFTGDLNLPPVGADEPGIVSFVVEDGDPVLDNEGNPITSEGVALFYFVNDAGVLEARAGDATGDVIFTITINGDGTFTYDQFGPMGSGGETSFEDLTSTSAGNVEFRGVGADDPATTIDLLLSAEAGGADSSVNTDSDSIGAANQSMDNGETVRIDFVSDLTTGAATPSGFGYSGHISTTSFIQLIPQVQGDQSQTTALTVWALDTSNTQANEPDRDPAGGFSDSTITPVTEVTVTDFLSGNSTTVDVTGFVVGVFTPVAYGISARVNADGSVTFSGIQQGDSYGISTGAGEFNAVAVQSEPAGTGGSTQDSFDLGVFSIGTGDVVEPISLTVPIALTDSDGDSVVCDIDINLGPPLDAPDITVTVNEAGLPIGSDPASDSEIQSGDLQGQVTGGTGPYTFVLVGSGDGAFGTLVLNPDGTFTYTLDTPFNSQPDTDDGTNPELGAESFTFEATDSLGATQTGTITVNIIDDVPTAVDDTDSIAAGQFGPETGNVITDASAGDAGDGDNGADTLGADGGTVVGVAAGDTNADLDNPATVGVVIQGTYGKLTLNHDGSYSYARDPGTDGGVEDVFTYTIEDGDGDHSNATLTITIADSPPTIDAPDQGEAGTVVDEKGLPTRPGEPEGSGEQAAAGVNGDPSETTAGVINFTAPDGPAIVRIDGVVVTGVVGQEFAGTHGTLTITSYNAGTGQIGYSYTLEDNTSGDATFDDFAIQVEDQDGDLANDTLVIDIIDDVPTANDDVDSVVGGFDPATGNVLTGTEVAVGEDTNGTDGVADVTGADDGLITNIDHAASPAEAVPNGGSTDIQGTYGVLTIYSNGDYSYQRDPGTPGGVEDVFTYTLTDGDGDTDTATLTIGIDDNFPTLPDPALVRLDDDALAGGNPGGTDDDVNAAGLPGQLNGSGGDGPLTYNFTGVDTVPAGFTVNPVNATTVQILQGATVVLTVTLNQATGAFDVVQNNPIDHPTPGESEENLVFQVGVEVEDADGDVEPATITINVDDDTPELSNVQAGSSVDVDETDAGSPAGFPISDTSVGAVITATQAFGADGAAAANSVVYGLAITGGPGTGIVTAIGNFPITLVAIDSDTIQGQYQDGGTQVAFTIQMNANGTVTLTQEVPLEHNTDGPPGPAHNDTLDLTGLINATVTITDGDGDSTSAAAPIGDNLVFFDDGPDAQVDGQAALDVLTLDETRPEGTDTAGGSAPTGDSQVTANFADNFVAPADHGGDGPGAVSYSLLLSANGIASGLFALDNTDISAGDGDGYGQGASITLSQAGNTITGSAGGTDYFTISIDPVTGVVTFTQLEPIWHPTAPASFDEAATLTTAAAANVQVVQTVTDSDGDSDTAAINVGAGVFVIQDDGPQAIQPDAASLENEAGASVTADLDDDGEVITDFGEDGPGLVQFANIVNGEDSGLTSDSDPIEYWLSNNGQTLQARTNSTNGIDGELIFTVQINQATGDYTVTMTGTVDNGSGVSFDDLTSSAAGNVNYRGVGEDDPATAVDLLLSASAPGGADATVNTDSDSIGSANQSTDEGETVRIDFVSNLTTGAATPSGFGYTGHVDTNSYLQTIPQVQGSQSETVAFRVYALDTADTQASNTDRNPAGGFANSSIVTVTEVTVISFDNATPITLDISGIAVNVWTTVGYGISVQKQADGSVIFTGVQQGDQYGISTGATDFNAVAVTALAAGVGPNAANDSSTNSFDLGVFSIGQVDTGDPIDISFDLQITDADGDTVALPGAIDITLEPATESLAFSATGQEEQLQKSAANSNTMTLAAAVAASGLVETQAAAAPAHDNGDRGHQVEDTSSGQQFVASVASNDGGSSAVSSEVPEAANDSAPVDSSSHRSGSAESDHSVDDGSAQADAQSNDVPAANDQGPASSSVEASPAALAVGMPSAEALQAAGVAGHAQQGGSVEQIVADALGQGNASAAVDALLNALPGGNGAVGALANLASPAANSVPGGDMSVHGAFASGHDMMFNVHAAMQHHDAVQPVANG